MACRLESLLRALSLLKRTVQQLILSVNRVISEHYSVWQRCPICWAEGIAGKSCRSPLSSRLPLLRFNPVERVVPKKQWAFGKPY